MKSPTKWKAANISLFWRFFALLTAIVILCLLVQLLSNQMYANALQQTYLIQAEESFKVNCKSFSSEIGLLSSLPPTLENSSYYSYISYIRGDLPPNRYFILTNLRSFLVKQTALLRRQTDMFYLLKGSYAGSTRLRSFPDMNVCFDTYLVYEDLSAKTMRQEIEAVKSISLLPVQNVSIDGAPGFAALTALVNSSTAGSNLVIGAIYPVDSVLDAFDISSLPENTYLRLSAADGTELLSYNSAVSDIDYIEFSGQLPSIGCTASLGIPKAWFRSITSPINRSVHIALLIAFAVGMGLCFVFSSLSVQPLRRLIGTYLPKYDSRDLPQNECHAIGRYLEDTHRMQKNLHTMLLSSLLDRAFSGLLMDPEEIRQLSQLFPFFSDELCVAIIRDHSNHDDTALQLNTLSVICETLPTDFNFKYINAHEIGVIFRNTPNTVEQLTQYLRHVNENANARLSCGISQPFHGLSSICQAAHQAYTAVPTIEERTVAYYNTDTRASDQEAPTIAGQKLEQFYHALQQWNRTSTLSILDQIEASLNHVPHTKEVLYALLYLLRDTAYSTGIPFQAYSNSIHIDIQSPKEVMHLLKELTQNLFQQYAHLQDSDRWQLQQDILAYVKAEFPDSTLCSDSVATHFSTSIHFVNSTIQQLTGQSFNKWLLFLRMQEAVALLRSTQENIDVISAKCGYPARSTFYRVFKKYYNVTPTQYRADYSQQED